MFYYNHLKSSRYNNNAINIPILKCIIVYYLTTIMQLDAKANKIPAKVLI